MTILLAYASRSRPDMFYKTVEAWSYLASGQHEIVWACEFDNDDLSMKNLAVETFCQERGIRYEFGASNTKIEAINATMRSAPAEWDVLICVSDDMQPVVDQWDNLVAVEFHERDGFHLDRAIWFPDGNQLRLCTLSIMGRPVYDRLGWIYHPEFKSVYCDDHFHNLMTRWNKLKFVDLQVFKHLHKVENNDALMHRNEHSSLYQHDQQLYQRLTSVR